MSTSSTDVIVIGAGLAGLACANKVAEAGLRVTVLEQSSDEAYLCNSRYTGGLFHIAMDDMAGEPDWVRANLERTTRGTTDPALAEALTQNARRTLRWLSSLGVRFIKAGPDGLRRNALSPPGVRQTGLNWRGRSGDVMLRTLGDRLRERGGELRRGVTAQSLQMEGGRCTGVLARTASGDAVSLQARAVLIADGGFQANPELVGRYICRRPERLLQRNAGSGQGAGLRMAEAAGALLVGMDRFYGHLQHRRAMTEQDLWPYPVVDSLATAALVVDASARRFCDEGLGGVYVTNAVAQLDDPLSAVIVFDDAIWNGPGRDWLLPANPYLLSAGGHLVSADTLPELATRLNLDPAALQDTVARYNRLADGEAGAQADQPPRSTAPYKAWPVRQGPFHAVEICAGITYTMGGIATDAAGRVLDTQRQPIDGLFAAGACTGGLEGGGEAAGYSGGLSKSSVFGMLAGEAIAQRLKAA
ncbi:FAD-dependent oxidoreductase [Hydrogenophaga sp.]|uniref:FAD-dependent oxidoreductase n=1 Tax=Hydrogenophaga sp. TaxID=1904254 RepID=UPI00262EC3A7|nr:FAD-dependent oxidoreductase [Hydrogenophaga sp.]MCW5656012.1 FAD-dependent oxidoreductase [Hydrogenophaga sp.]